MLNNFNILLKTFIKSQFNLKSIKVKWRKNKGILIGFIFVIMYLEATLLGQSILLAEMGLGEYIPVLAFLVVMIISLVSSFSRAGDEIYNFKNKEILLTFPIKVSDIVQSRMILMYLYNLVFVILISIPFLITYLIYVKTSILNVICWIVFSVLTPIIPICISVFFSAIFGKISSRFKRNNYINNLLMLIFTIGVLIGSIYYSYKISSAGIKFDDIGYFIARLLENFTNWIPPLKWINELFKNEKIMYILLYFSVSVIVYVITFKYITYKYIDINSKTRIKTRTKIQLNAEKNEKQKTILKTLYIKELKSYTSSKIYAVNTFFGTIMLVVFAVFVSIFKIDKFITILGMRNGEIIKSVYPYMAVIIIGMACTTQIAISFEGKRIWFIKSSPINKKDFYNSKLLLYFTTVFPGIIVFIVSEVFNDFRVIDILMSFMLTTVAMIFMGVLGLRIDLKFLKYDWENETKLVKQSVNQLITVTTSFVIVIIPVIVIINFQYLKNIVTLVVSVILGFWTLIIYKRILQINY